MKPATAFKLFLLFAFLLPSVALKAQADRTPYTVLPQPIEVNSFPYVEEGFDSDAVASGIPTGLSGSCSQFPCCSGVWYKVTITSRGSLYAGFDKYLLLSSSLIWYKADSENITTTDQLTYIKGPNNFCGLRGQGTTDFGYLWERKYGSAEQIAEAEAAINPGRELAVISQRSPATIPDDLSVYPADGWSYEGTPIFPRFVEPGTYWLYAWNSNQQTELNGPDQIGDHKLVIDFVELCPSGFDCFSENVTICSEESFTTPGGAVITETSAVEETIGNRITTYNVTLDEDIFCCPEGVNCTAQSATICTAEVFTTPNGTSYAEAGRFVETIDANTRINWTITEDPSINCCPDGFTCNIIDVTECANAVYTSPLGNTLSADGTVVDVDNANSIRNTYNVTFQRANVTSDIFKDAIIARSGSVTYRANTSMAGVLQFDKSQDYWINLNALADDLDGKSRSVFMWVKSEANVANDNQVLFAINKSNGDNRSFLFIDNSGDNLEVNRGGTNNQSGSYDMSDQLWHYVGYTYDVNTNETVIYVDGLEQSRGTRDQDAVATDQYSLGQEFDGSNDSDHFNSVMTEVSVWDEVLTGADIRRAMQEKITDSHPKFANLVGYYSVFGACDDDTAVLKDHSGKGNNGVMQNGFTQDFENVQSVDGFNAVGWYSDLSWKKEGTEVSTASAFTTNVAAGNYEFTATRSFIKSTDTWSMTLNSNAETVDNIADETLCSDATITRTIGTNKVNYLDFEETEDNYIDLSPVVDDIAGKSRSVFMWLNKESNIGSEDFNEILVFQSSDVDDLSRFYIRSTEKLALWDGVNSRLNSSTELANDTWYFVGYTYDNDTGETKLYVNGTAEDNGTFAMPLGENWFASLGMKYNSNGPEHFMDGKLADITMWDKVLSEAEITTLMGAAPTPDAANLVAAYGTLKAAADNQLRDLTANGNDGVATHSSIFVTDTEEEIPNYDASTNYLISWTKAGTEFDTDASAEITIAEGAFNYGVVHGLPFFQRTDAFALSYTNLLPTQPISKSAGVNGSVTFEVDQINGASYQWFKVGQGEGSIEIPDNPQIKAMATGNGKLFVGTPTGLAISDDGGESWSMVTQDTPGFPDSNFILSISYNASTKKLYAGTGFGVAVSPDDGITWSVLTGYSDRDDGIVTAIESEGPNIYIAFLKRGTLDRLIRYSNDGGTTWSSSTTGLTNDLSAYTSNFFTSGNKLYASSRLFTRTDHSTNPTTVTKFDGSLIVSSDKGQTWTRLGSDVLQGETDSDINSFYVEGNNIYVATEGGLFISRDSGSTFVKVPLATNGYSSSSVTNAVSGTGNTVYVATDGGLSITSDAGLTWVTDDTSPIDFVYATDETVFYTKLFTNSRSQYNVRTITNKIRLTDEADNTATNQIQGANSHQLTINNLDLNLNQEEYFVEVTKDNCTQPSDKATLTVLPAPALVSVSPANGSTDINISTALQLTYEGNITAGTGSLRIFEYDTDVEKFSGTVSASGTKASIAEGSFTLSSGIRYYVLLDADVVRDDSGNGSLAVTDKNFWTFTTACEALILTQPENKTGFIGSGVTFSVPQVEGASYQWFKRGERTFNRINPDDFDGVRRVSVANGKIYATLSNSRIFAISSDRGNTWTFPVPGQNGFREVAVVGLYVNGDNIYLSSFLAISISTDGGTTWNTTRLRENGFDGGESARSIYAEGDKVYVATELGLSVSTDGGATWATMSKGQNGFPSSSNSNFIYGNGEKLFVATNGGLAISSDGGATWTTTTSGQNGFDQSNLVTWVHADGDKVYATTASEDPNTRPGALSISTDGGATWTTTARGENGLAAPAYTADDELTGVHAVGETIAVGSENGGVSISTDGGATWTTTRARENGFSNNQQIRAVYVSGEDIYVSNVDQLMVFTDQNQLFDEADNIAENRIQGATTHELTINNLTADFDQTQYFVKITRGICTESSDNITLTLQEAPPVIAALSPADDETDVARLINPSITFDKAIGRGTGNIEVHRASDDELITTIAANTTSVSITDKTATLRLGTTRFEFGTEYYITIPEGAFISTNGGVFGGISDKTTWSFTIIGAPAIATATPADDATDVVTGINEAGLANAFSVVFDQDVLEGMGGGFDLFRSEDDKLVGRTAYAGPDNTTQQLLEDNRTFQFFFIDPETSEDRDQGSPPIRLEEGTSYYILTYGMPFEDFEITDKTAWNFSTEPPELKIASLSPADDAMALRSEDLDAGLPTIGTFSVTFDQSIAFNNTSASFELYTVADDQLVASQTLASTISGPASGDFNTIGFSFASYDFLPDTEYYILIDAGMVKSQAFGVEFDGISDKTVWNFKTAPGPFSHAGAYPSVATETGQDVPLNINEMTTGHLPGHLLVLPEGFYTIGEPGKIGLYTSADDALVYELDLANETISLNPSGAVISNRVSLYTFQDAPGGLAILDDVVLNPATQYYWKVDEGILLNANGGRFAGISDKTAWTFTTKTQEVSPLEVQRFTPESDEVLDLDHDQIFISFARGTEIAAGTGTLTIFRASDDSVFETLNISDFTIRNASVGARLTADVKEQFELGETYYVQYPAGFIKSKDGTRTVAAVEDKTTYTFGTGPVAGAIFERFFPAPGSTDYDASRGKDFKAYTTEDINQGALMPVGTIRIFKGADNSLVKTLDFNDYERDFDTYPEGGDRLEIEIGRNELEPDTEYYVLIDDGFIVSDEPQYHKGISDPNTWRFRTAALPTEPIIASTNPVNNSTGASINSSLELIFSENVRAGSGNVVIFEADGTVFETIAVNNVGISAASVTITPTGNFDFSTTYYVQIDATAFESTNGVNFAGIADDNTWRFTTQAMPNTAPVASAQDFSGRLEVPQQLTGTYNYSDADADPETNSVYQWYMADDAAGNNAAPIAGANAQNYTLTAAEEGKFLALAITPFDGEDAGTEVFTDYKGPVVAAIVPTLVSTMPADNATEVDKATNLSFELSEPVNVGTGSIRATSSSGGNMIFAVTSSEVTVSGTNITIDPLFDLEDGAFYTITFDGTAFVDADGNNAADLNSETVWNFTTARDNASPEASGVTINRSQVVDGELQGSYTYSDEDGDAEDGSLYLWYRADDADGTNKAPIFGVATQNYTATNEDDGKFLSFEVTPGNGNGFGTAVESALLGPIVVNTGNNNIAPAFTSDALTSILDNETYTYTITFEDLNNDTPVLTITSGPDWLSVSGFDLMGNPTAANIGMHYVVLTLDDQNGGTTTQSFTVIVEPSNIAPTVAGIEIAGITTIDEELIGSYNFLDEDGDADNSSYQWYRADDAQGSNKTAIAGATSTTYTLTADDAARFISFEVTPNDGMVDGTADESMAVGAVAKKVPTLILMAIAKTYGDTDFDLVASTNSSGAIAYAFDNDQTGASLNGNTVMLGNVGTITVDVSLVEDAEFEARIVTGTINVAQKAIEFTATDAGKNIGEDDPELTFTVTSGEVIGDDVVVTLSRDVGEEAGTYTIGFTDGADAANYDISKVNGTFTISQLALTVTANAATKIYGEPDPTFTFDITSGVLAAGDELSGTLTRDVGEDVGTYALESSVFNPKYDITFVPANLTISKADLSISVDDQSRNFGEANPEFTLSFEGLRNGDRGVDFDTPPVATTTATETSAPGTYDIILNSPADANYNITGTTNGTLTVNNVDIALSIADITANEDDGDITVTVALDNAVSGGFTVDVSTSDGTATAGMDYTAVAGQTLTFSGTAGEEQTFMVTPTGDFLEEADETLTVSLSNLAGTTLPVDITDEATVTLANDDVDSDLFIITFETTADNESVNLPTQGSGYNYGIDWGDGTIDFGVTGDREHTYATAGTYTVRITGDFPRIYFKGAEDAASDANALKIKSVEQWGTNVWTSMRGAFEGAMNMVINATDTPDLSIVLNLEEMFSDCDGLTTYDFSAWDVSTVTNMKEMFERADNFNGNISNWDVSNVTNMEQMFKNAISFNGDITGWNTGNVENMSEMFRKSTSAPSGSEMSFNQDIDGWDVSSVTDFGRMFEDNNVFNQDLNSWDVSSAEDMSFMFRRTDVFNGNISDWDVSSVTEMQNMFGNALVFNQDISGWDVSKVERMDEMFDGALQFNANIRNWDVSSVENMEQMFEDTDNFNADISIWQTSSLTNMEGMFLRAKAFNQDISDWDISGITSLNETFEDADAFNQDISGWNTSAITSMKSLFKGADVFNQDLSGWNVSTVTNMGSLFLNATAFDQSLANWNIGAVSDMGDMLSGSGLSVANYDATLTSWAGQTVQSGVTLGATGLEFCASLTDRQSLIDNDGWTLDGDIQGCETVLTFTETGGVEDDGDIVVTVTSSNAIIGGFTVDVNTADGTATAGNDYTAVVSETLTFAGTAGEEQTFIVSPTADSDDEPNETITVSMDNLVVGAGNTVDIDDQSTVTIFNEDVAEAFFTTIWETSVDNESISIPTSGEGYNYRIDWGDGTIEKNQTGDATHAYATAGEYTVKIVGSFPRIIVANVRGNESKLKSVEQWGTIEWLSMEGAFAFVTDLEINVTGSPDLSRVTSMVRMFQSASNMNSDISGWDVSNVEDMRSLFQSATAFNQDISGWNVSKVTNMAAMFSGAKAFNQPLGNWNVSNVTSMQLMFTNADAFNQDLNSWDVSKVEFFDGMFKQTDVFNGNITAWNVSSGTDFEEMFQEADAFNQAIGNWNLASATNVRRMFQETEVFNQSLNNWRFPNLTSVEAMFRKSVAFNQDLNDWEMGNITKVDDIFEEAEAFNGNISNWDVSRVTNFDYAFDEAENFNQDISGWDVSKGENFRNMFDEATNFNQDLSAWQVGNGTNFFRMFNRATSFDQDISGWDVTSATNMSSMLNNSGLSIANYDALLTAWAKQDVQSNLTLGVTGLQYCAGSNGRQSLIDVKGWTIENDGINCVTIVTIEDVMAVEDGGDITVTLTSSSFVADGFTVDVSTTDGTAIAGTDYTAVTAETVAFFGAAGETQVFTITPTSDTVVEPDETLTVSMSNVVSGASNTITVTDQATITIENDDQPTVAFSSISASNSEATTSADIQVTLDQAGLAAVSVDYAISGMATGGGTDFTLAAGTLNFAIGDVSETISLGIIDDDIIENNETIVITLSNPSGASLGANSTFTYTIEDDDQATVSLAAQTVEEGDGTVTITATLDKAVDGGFSVDLQPEAGTATQGVDYMGLSNVTLTFAGTAGETQTTTVTLIDDEIVEGEEVISVAFNNLANTTLDVNTGGDVNLTIQDNDQAIVTIEDVSGNEDDGDITITLQLNKALTGGFSVDVSTADGTATAGTDYTALNGETITFAGNAGETQTIVLSPTTDTDVEGSETLSVSMSNLSGTMLSVTITDDATVTIIGDDQPVVAFASTAIGNSESVTSSDIEVRLDQAGLSTVTVDYAVTGTATGAGTDYTLANGTLTFTAGDVSENISLGVIDDDLVEANETVVITLSNAQGASIGANGVFTYTIEDEDEATVSLTAITVSEGDGTATIVATLDNAVDEGFAVDLTTAESSAFRGIDYIGLENVTLTFAGTAGEMQSTTINLIDDDIVELTETISVLFGNLANTSLNVTTGGVVEISITDNDVATLTIADVSQVEDGGAISLTATLDKAVVGGFTVDVSGVDGTATTADGDYTAIVGQTLSFSGTAGETQSFEVVPGTDARLEANETLTVSMSNLMGTTLPVTITDEATLTIINDDAAAVTIIDASGNEDDGAITVTATLDNAVQGGFTVEVSTVDGTATVANNDYSAVTSHTLTFAGTAGETQTFTVTPTNDLIIENDESLTVSMSNLSTSLGVDITDGATVTIVNDDFNNFPTDITLSATSIAENNALDATIGNLTTTDADAGDSHTYSLVSGMGGADNGTFTIDGNILKVNNTSFNFEDRTSYSIRVQTDDGAGGIYSKALTIGVTNVNESPFALSLTNSTIDEADDAQEVGGLMTLDPDNGDTFTYALIAGEGDTHNSQFAINGNTLSTAGAINFEDGAGRSIRVEVTDAGGLTFVQTFTITIEDVVAEPVREFTTNVPGGEVKNMFSPNGDGINETWVIEDLQDNPFNEVRVFAQGGKLIYSKVNYQNDWAGTFRDDPVPDGTYYYEIIIFENSQSNTPARVIKGFLTIIRNR